MWYQFVVVIMYLPQGAYFFAFETYYFTQINQIVCRNASASPVYAASRDAHAKHATICGTYFELIMTLHIISSYTPPSILDLLCLHLPCLGCSLFIWPQHASLFPRPMEAITSQKTDVALTCSGYWFLFVLFVYLFVRLFVVRLFFAPDADAWFKHGLWY